MREIVRITAPENLTGATIRLPGSKSIANRLLMLRHLYGPTTTLHNLPDGDDTAVLIKALHAMNQKRFHIDAGHAGTAFRFLTALCAVTPGDWLLSGSERMLQRPIAPLVNALKQLGADIDYHQQHHFPPLNISGRRLTGGKVYLDASISSQFTSALCMIAPSLIMGIEIEFTQPPVSYSYVEMTLQLLKQYGATVHDGKRSIKVLPSSLQLPAVIETEGDWSSASYWYSICALAKGSSFTFTHLNKESLQGDSVVATIFEQLGVSTEVLPDGVKITHHGRVKPTLEINFSDCPDLTQTIMVTCLGLGIHLTCTGISTLAHKETDRITALVKEITALGGHVGVHGEALVLQPIRASHPNAIIETYQDHRMALAFAPLALVLPQISLNNPQVVTKSYPTFWNHLKAVGFGVNLQP